MFFFSLSTYQCGLVVCECLPLYLWGECLWVCWCVGKVKLSPCQTDGYQQGSSEWVLLYSGAKRLSCNLHCLSLIFSLSRCTFHLLCVCLRAHLFPLHSMVCVNISVCDKGTEGACWLVFVSVLQADTGGNKRHAGSCPAQSLHWVPLLMAIPDCVSSQSHYLT